jgi:hypothetical protein
MRRFAPTTEQLAMIENIGEALDVTPVRGRARAPAGKRPRGTAGKPATKPRPRAR